jgi:hypothetical protein
MKVEDWTCCQTKFGRPFAAKHGQYQVQSIGDET